MPDEDKAVNEQPEQAVSDSPTEETTVPEESVKEPQEEAQPQEDSQDSESTEDINKPERSNRAERRIHSLVDKLKETKEQQDQTIPAREKLPWEVETNPYESLSGEVTPEQLQSLIQTEADKFAQVRVAQLENKFKQKAVAEDFISDLESTGEQIQKDFGDSPETAKKVDELLADLNNKLNVDEKGNLRPRQKTSDLYKQIKSALQAERLTGQEQSTTKMAENIANAAIAPSNRQPQDSSLEDLQAEMVKNPARVAKILEERLPISED